VVNEQRALFSSSVERTTMTVVPRLRSVALPEDEEVSGEAAPGGELAASAPRDECGGSAEEEEEEEWGEERRKELDLVSTVESGRGTLAISADQRRHVFFSPSSLAKCCRTCRHESSSVGVGVADACRVSSAVWKRPRSASTGSPPWPIASSTSPTHKAR
jgi:hypothetical protein